MPPTIAYWRSLLAVFERRGEPPLETLSPPEAREALHRRLAVTNGPPPPVGAVRDLEVAGGAGPLGRSSTPRRRDRKKIIRP